MTKFTEVIEEKQKNLCVFNGSFFLSNLVKGGNVVFISVIMAFWKKKFGKLCCIVLNIYVIKHKKLRLKTYAGKQII